PHPAEEARRGWGRGATSPAVNGDRVDERRVVVVAIHALERERMNAGRGEERRALLEGARATVIRRGSGKDDVQYEQRLIRLGAAELCTWRPPRREERQHVRTIGRECDRLRECADCLQEGVLITVRSHGGSKPRGRIRNA